MDNPDVNENELVSYLTLRRVVGVLGVALPVVVAVWGFALSGSITLQDSISDYYSLRTRDAFVGILFTVGWFLYTYRGYERRDNIAGNLACLFALCIALFPNSGSSVERVIHFASAAAFFIVLSYFSMALFTQSGGVMTPRKKIRNKIYVTCGLVMLACIVLIGLYSLFLKGSAIAALKPVFWLELIALWAFGVSWFIKGETLWRDQEV